METALFIRCVTTWSLLILCVFIPYGCDRYHESYFPLDKGWHWVYSIEVKTIEGRKVEKSIIENLGRTMMQGQKVSVRRTWGGTTYYYREDASGVLRVGESLLDKAARLYSTPIIVLPNQAAPSSPPWNDWEYTAVLRRAGSPKAAELVTKITVQLQINYVIESVNDEIVVPAGRFEHCLRVHGTGVTYLDFGFPIGPTTIRVLSTEWYARGVGLIKAERKETTNSPIVPAGEYRMELEEFHNG